MEGRFDCRTARFVLISPLPRYLEKCYATQGHFDTYFDGGDLCAEILRLGVYLSRLPCNRFAVCITPEDICPRDTWGIRGEMLSSDRVHLTDKGFKILSGITHRGILCVMNPPPSFRTRGQDRTTHSDQPKFLRMGGTLQRELWI